MGGVVQWKLSPFLDKGRTTYKEKLRKPCVLRRRDLQTSEML